jgi:transposase InsO family protein
MSITAVSVSSRSAGCWACRRPRITSAGPGGDRPGRSVMSGCWNGSSGCMRPTAAVTATAARGRRCGARVSRSAATGSSACCARTGFRGPSGAARRGDHDRRRDRRAQPGSGAARLRGAGARSLVGGGLHLSALLGGLLFFAFVIDVYSRRVVGWQLAPHMRTTLVLDALRMALSRRRGGADVRAGAPFRRGQSGQYTS